MILELIHKLLNITAPTFTFFCVLFFYPPFLFFKFLQSIWNTIFSEDVAGKVVLITGASSGIGESLAYEYASRGACLALVARREERLRNVVELAIEIGSPDVLMIIGDVSNVDDCKRIVDKTIHHFRRLDHLVNNAGITSVALFEEITNITAFKAIMDTNFWGSVYTARFAVPHLRNTNGKIVVLGSSSWLPQPRLGIYNASKAATAMMFESLRVELGPDINITIVTPAFIESEFTQEKFVDSAGKLIFDPDSRDIQISAVPVRSVSACAKAIVNGVVRRRRYVTDPSWFGVTYVWKLLCPELLEWGYRLFYLTWPHAPPKDAPSKTLADILEPRMLLTQQPS